MSRIIKKSVPDSKLFKASINSGTLPTIASTSTIPSGKTWIAHGVCKLVETAVFATSGVSTTSAAGATTTGTGMSSASGGGSGGAVSSGTGSTHYCARWCALWCAGGYCGLSGYAYGFGYGYGFGFGYGYGTARGYSGICKAIGVNGSTSWTQIVPSGFTVTTWLYYEEMAS